MFENMSFEYILRRALSRVKTDVDKRQGSIIWDALAPACAELAQIYIELDHILAIAFASTSHGEWLEKRCSEMGIYREPPTSAIRLGLFYKGSGSDRQPFDVPIGSRYSLETLNYVVVKRLAMGQFELACEETGIVGNQLFGRLIPIETIRGLSYGELSDVLIPGEDMETDESLFYRYEEAINTTPFGGNIDDYRQKVRKLDGVADCKPFPAWNGGGTVKVCLITTEYNSPTEILIATVQEALDPVPYHQHGKGIAPIGHYVTVTGVQSVSMNLVTTLVLRPDTALGQVQLEIEEILKNYFLELAKTWADETATIIRINQIEAKILNIRGIIDISGTTLNGGASNIILETEQIPIMGSVTLYD